MTQFLTGEIRGGDITKPRVYITGGSTAYKGKTVTCRAGNDLRGTRKVSVIVIDDKVLGKRFTAFSDKAQAHNPETINQSITIKKQPKKPVKTGDSLKILFVKRELLSILPAYKFTWFLGGDRTTPIELFMDEWENLSPKTFNYYEYDGFNNTGFGDKFVGFLKQTIEDFDIGNSTITNDLITRVMYKDSPATEIISLQETNITTGTPGFGNTVITDRDFYNFLLEPTHPSISTNQYNFINNYQENITSTSGGDTFGEYWSNLDRTESSINRIYKADVLSSEFTYDGLIYNRYDDNSGTTTSETYLDFTCLVLPDPDVYLQFPYDGSVSGNYQLIGFNDKKSLSLGLHTEFIGTVATTEYRLYNRDKTYKSMPYDPNNPPELLTFESKNINWVDDKLYVADAWINDPEDEFYESGSYIGADMDSMGGNEPYPKWDAKTPVIIRVYEFKDHPDESDQFIIEQVDAFLFDAERITPSDYDYTDTGSDGRPVTDPLNPLYYYPVALSYHPG